MKIGEKNKETEKNTYKYFYGKWIKTGVIKTQENDNTRDRKLGK